jgi:hypothetical protein
MGLILLLALVVWFYWSKTRRIKRHSMALSDKVESLSNDKRALGKSIELLRLENERLQEGITAERSSHQPLMRELNETRSAEQDLARRVAELTAENGQLIDDRVRYEYAMRAMADRSRRPMRHLSQTIIYMIGETPVDDVVTESYQTTALSEKEPLLWHHVSLGLTNQASVVQSFRDLSSKSVFEVLPNPPPPIRELDYVPTGRRDNRLGVLIFFDPEIGMTPRRWTLTYRWPGMWEPLRNTGRDTAIIRLGESPTIERDFVVVVFVFPLSFSSRNPAVRMTGQSAQRVEAVWDADTSGRSRAIFKIEKPHHEDYDWVLEARDIRRPRGR